MNTTPANTMPTVVAFWPELGGRMPANTDAVSRLWPNGKRYTVRVRPGFVVVSGRGVELECVETVNTLRAGSKFVGWTKYNMTRAAFAKFSRTCVVASEALLD